MTRPELFAWLAIALVACVIINSRYICRLLACVLLAWDDAQGAMRAEWSRSWASNFDRLSAGPARATGAREQAANHYEDPGCTAAPRAGAAALEGGAL